MVKSVRGLPWKTSPEETGEGAKLPEPLVVRQDVTEGLLPPTREVVRPEVIPPRRVYIRQAELDAHGYTAGCDACAAIREGRARAGINHSEHCRKRITDAMKATSAGQARLDREGQREQEFFEKVRESEEKRRKADTSQEASQPKLKETPQSAQRKPLTIARQPPLGQYTIGGSSSCRPSGVAASATPPTGQKREGDGGDDEQRAEVPPTETRSEPQKRKAPENTEGMIEEIITQEREDFILSVQGKTKPTCDLEDDLWEEKFFDENTGKQLPPEGVKQARMEEIETIKSMGVWEVIPRPPGEKTIGTRWIDINKGDSLHMKLRSRLVAQELKRKKGYKEGEDQVAWTDFFAAMPPLSSLRALFTLATTSEVPDKTGKLTRMDKNGEVCVLFVDVKKAHFWSPVRRRLLVELPPEAGEDKTKVGLLKRSLYGTRDAPSNWEHAIKDVMESIGFNQGVSNPCLYVHDEFSLRCNVHGDDFTVVGSYDKLRWLIQNLKKAWTIEVRGILARPGSRLPNICHQISVLNRLISWTEHGIELEADPRHVELVLEQAASVTTPLVKSKGDEEESPLTDQEAGYYRSIAMRIGFLSMDRPDMLRTVRELAKGLKSPTSFHWTLLKRAARYLKGVPRLLQLIPNQDSFSTIQAWSDTDHAGCVRTRKSTTGTVIQLGRSVIKATAKGQAVIALSSREAEYYGLISTASAALGEQAMLEDWNISCPVYVNMDATTGISIGSRRGLGKVKHIATCYLWVQDLVDRQRIRLRKVNTGDMLADIMTKPLDAGTIRKFLSRMGFNPRDGRHKLSLKV